MTLPSSRQWKRTAILLLNEQRHSQPRITPHHLHRPRVLQPRTSPPGPRILKKCQANQPLPPVVGSFCIRGSADASSPIASKFSAASRNQTSPPLARQNPP